MSRNRTIALVGALLAAVGVLAAAAPAMAHPGAPTTPTAAPTPPAPEAPTPPAAAVVAPEDPPASDSSGLTPWIAAGVLLLAGVLLRRFSRRSRRTLVLCLVLLLACTLAMASAQLSAVAVDGVVETPIVLAAAGHVIQPGRPPVPARGLRPDPGRAPPAKAA
jgi:pyruvate/2-oxoglutarate dehydrogenase complex dihydrolipoamide acyltransferase (E2) component